MMKNEGKLKENKRMNKIKEDKTRIKKGKIEGKQM